MHARCSELGVKGSAMELQRGIVLFNTVSESPSETMSRLKLSSGMQRAVEIAAPNEFCDFAIFPRGPWVSVTSDQYARVFVPNEDAKQGLWISIVEIPGDLLKPFALLKEAAAQGRTADEINALISTNEQFIHALPSLTDYCSQFNHHHECLSDGAGIRANAPGLITVTQNKDRSCQIGLHLDSWYRAPLSQRQLSPNRICINLGPEDRYLLFINLALQQMSDAIHASGVTEAPLPVHELDLLGPFLHRFPSYPVTRLSIKPGEAYIAPTENMIHDGSTLNRVTTDVQLTILGNFQANKVQYNTAQLE